MNSPRSKPSVYAISSCTGFHRSKIAVPEACLLCRIGLESAENLRIIAWNLKTKEMLYSYDNTDVRGCRDGRWACNDTFFQSPTDAGCDRIPCGRNSGWSVLPRSLGHSWPWVRQLRTGRAAQSSEQSCPWFHCFCYWSGVYAPKTEKHGETGRHRRHFPGRGSMLDGHRCFVARTFGAGSEAEPAGRRDFGRRCQRYSSGRNTDGRAAIQSKRASDGLVASGGCPG